MDNYIKLMLELKGKKEHLESELAKKEKKQEELEYEIGEEEHSYGLMKNNEETYINLKNILENYHETIKEFRKTNFLVWVVVSALIIAITAILSASFIALFSDTSFLDNAIFSIKVATLSVMPIIGGLCLTDYRDETAEIRRTKKDYTIAELDKEIADVRSKADGYSKSLASLEEAKKENSASILKLEQQIEAIAKEIDLIIESREKALAMPQVEAILNQAFQANPELNLIRELRNPEK